MLYSILIAEAISLAGVLVAYATYRRVSKEKRDARVISDAAFRSDIVRLQVDFARETGGNSGGMREAINTIRATQIDIAARSETTTDALHRLEGSFETHMLMHTKG